MADIIIKLFQAIILVFILFTLMHVENIRKIYNVKGLQMILFGFALLLFGTVIDIVSHLSELDRAVMIDNISIIEIIRKVFSYLLGFIFLSIGIWQWFHRIEEQNIKTSENVLESQKNEKDEKTLEGVLVVCASCKKILVRKGFWEQIEDYITRYSEARFSHTICPKCAKQLYPELYGQIEDKIELEEELSPQFVSNK